ncbi:TIGR03862 family flavoprotein [Hyphomicrobium sp. CS1GBMeth3]|uniref:NAD(P)/FAD-dependent oxidoreductase n=1 Tax=Hyphomicrobium sp. CS1GBMeth3 TaxID=1892845 RepID=UPI0011149BF7|nr:TIGR03862 family flavoprotein [Hyphomicrobium sp. CS1GBMeth3]
MQHTDCHTAVIGGGPAGLMAAETLATSGAKVTLYERMPRIARKFLLAGRGGLNLTHSEPLDVFLTRYRRAAPSLRAAIEKFPPAALRAWSEELGQETFVGSSGRVFPRAMKTSPFLRAWLKRLENLGVELRLGHRWKGWDEDGGLIFETAAGDVGVAASCTVLALGGASWPRLGSDASWINPLAEAGALITPLMPSNSGVRVAWSEVFRTRYAGTPLKRIAMTCGGETARGEAMITAEGIEGGAIYALSAPIREALSEHGAAEIMLDLRPDEQKNELLERLAKPRGKQSLATWLRKSLRLEGAAAGLLHEAVLSSGTSLGSMTAEALAELIKAVPIRTTGLASIDRAISTAGGLSFDELDETFMLRARPGTFVAGEMLDWDAPTGGYLLQACFATGRAAAEGARAYLARELASNPSA